MQQKQSLALKRVTALDCPFLYKLLNNRKNHVNISHKKMPTYNQHMKFVLSKPYSSWYIIMFKNQKVGSVYLSKQNEIGIFLIDEMIGKGIGVKALKLLMEKNSKSRYLANINPKNKESIRFFKKIGFEIIQHTYELINTKHGKKN